MVYVPDPYKALNLPHSASLAQIKQAYRQLARKHHPDTWSQPCFSEADRREATAKFTAISNAYALLTDPQQKAEYDRTYNLGGYRRDEEDADETPAASKNTTRSHTNPATGTKTNTTPKNPHYNNPRQSNPLPTPPPPPPCPPPPSPTTGYWVSAVDPKTRRTYYYNKATGERSWTLMPDRPNPHYHHTDYQRMYGDPSNDANTTNHDPPSHHHNNNHACESFTALLLCPPLGILAVFHSVRAQRETSPVRATNHARLASQYACWGNALGVCFWLYWFLLRGDEPFDWNMRDWNWGDNGP